MSQNSCNYKTNWYNYTIGAQDW